MAKELTCHVLLLLLLRLLLLLSPAVSFNVRTRVRERECSSVFLRSTRRYRRRRRHHQLALERDGKRGGGEERAELSTLYRRLPSCQKLVCVCVPLLVLVFFFFPTQSLSSLILFEAHNSKWLSWPQQCWNKWHYCALDSCHFVSCSSRRKIFHKNWVCTASFAPKPFSRAVARILFFKFYLVYNYTL